MQSIGGLSAFGRAVLFFARFFLLIVYIFGQHLFINILVGVHISHELRTPMACIIGLLDMLLTENLSVEHEGSVRQIHRCATSLVSLLNSALDIAKVDLSLDAKSLFLSSVKYLFPFSKFKCIFYKAKCRTLPVLSFLESSVL